MPDPSVSCLQKILEGVAVKLIVAGLVLAGTAAMTWYSAHSAYLSGKPFYEVAPYVAGVACLCFITLYYSWLWLERLQTFLTANRLKWLSDIAEVDRLGIDAAVILKGHRLRDVCISEDKPYFSIFFQLFNGSVFPVEVERKVDGFIKFNTTPLEGRLVMTARYWTGAFNSREGGSFEVSLWLSEKEAKMITDAQQKHQPANFLLDQLLITIKGAREDDRVIPKNLRLANVAVPSRKHSPL